MDGHQFQVAKDLDGGVGALDPQPLMDQLTGGRVYEFIYDEMSFEVEFERVI
jgi:hypothetical protein